MFVIMFHNNFSQIFLEVLLCYPTTVISVSGGPLQQHVMSLIHADKWGHFFFQGSFADYVCVKQPF